MRKLYDNLTITAVSVIVALLVGGIEALGLIGDELGLRGPVWEGFDSLNDHSGTIGFLIIGIFAASRLITTLIYRARGYHRLDAES